MNGFGKVALADIAQAADVPLGNLYYYFKTKTAIGETIVAQRVQEFEQLRAHWDQTPSPAERLKALVQMTMDNRQALVLAGCPVGSLCAELGKEQTPLAEMAARPLRELRTWMEVQFSALGRDNDKAALALHLLAALQGVSLLANCLRDSKLVEQEARLLTAWIDTL
jgi:AcrR family transcriptional regulator